MKVRFFSNEGGKELCRGDAPGKDDIHFAIMVLICSRKVRLPHLPAPLLPQSCQQQISPLVHTTTCVYFSSLVCCNPLAAVRPWFQTDKHSLPHLTRHTPPTRTPKTSFDLKTAPISPSEMVRFKNCSFYHTWNESSEIYADCPLFPIVSTPKA